MTVENRSVVTSGTYERYFEQNGKRYHHILDPRTGYPLDNELDSVTIISPDSLDGDIWTTLIYGMGVERAAPRCVRAPILKPSLSPKQRSGDLLDAPLPFYPSGRQLPNYWQYCLSSPTCSGCKR